MNFSVDKDILLKSLLIADSIVSTKPTSHILSLCLFNVINGKLEIIATDKEIMIKTSVDIRHENDFSFLTNGKKLANIIREFPKGEISFELEENYSIMLKSKSIKGEYVLVGMPSDEFPEFKKIDEVVSFEMHQSEFKDMLRKVSYAMATDNIKPAFCGIYFVTEEVGKLTAVATDAKRLSLFTVQNQYFNELKEGVIVPNKAISEMMKILSNVGKCVFAIGTNMCSLEADSTIIISRLVDGVFPNYRQVIPRDFIETIVVDRRGLIETLKRVQIFASEPLYKVIFRSQNGVLKVFSETQDFGRAVEEINVVMMNDQDLQFALNSNHLYDSLKEIDDDEVEIKIMTVNSPIVICPKGKKEEMSVIMPIQIKSE